MPEHLQNTLCGRTGYNMHGYNIPLQFQQATPILLQECSTKSNPFTCNKQLSQPESPPDKNKTPNIDFNWNEVLQHYA